MTPFANKTYKYILNKLVCLHITQKTSNKLQQELKSNAPTKLYIINQSELDIAALIVIKCVPNI